MSSAPDGHKTNWMTLGQLLSLIPKMQVMAIHYQNLAKKAGSCLQESTMMNAQKAKTLNAISQFSYLHLDTAI